MSHARRKRLGGTILLALGAWWPAAALPVAAAERGAATRGGVGDLFSIGTAGTLHRIDPGDGSVLSTVPITLPGDSISAGNGLAAEPATGELWGVVSIPLQSGRELVTIDPSSGTAASVGNTGQFFAALAFDDTTLYGLTGTAGGAVLRRIDRTTAASESLLVLTNGAGHAMAFDSGDGLLYHATGGLLEKVDVDLLTVTPVPTSGYAWIAARGMASAGAGTFVFAAVDPFFPSIGIHLSLTSTGFADSLGVTASSKGLAFLAVETGTPPGGELALALRSWPNPLRDGSLRVSLGRVPGGSLPTLDVFDLSGRRVRAVSPSSSSSVGGVVWNWDGRDRDGRSVPAGVYFLRLRDPRVGETTRVVIVR